MGEWAGLVRELKGTPESVVNKCLATIAILGAIAIALLIGGVHFGPVTFQECPSAPGSAAGYRQMPLATGVLAAIALFLFALGVILWRKASKPRRNKRPDRDLKEEDYDRVFELTESAQFYDLIAKHYEDRTSPQRDQTNEWIHSVCRTLSGDLSNKSIADLGGGAGSLLRKFQHYGANWVNFDHSNKTLDIFRQNFLGQPNVKFRALDICSPHFKMPGEKFDILILSFVLSSVDGRFPYKNLLSLMKDDSILIIADNVGAYAKDRLFGFEDIEGKNYALRVRPMEESAIDAEARAVGLKRVDRQFVFKDNLPYSQIQVFQLAAPRNRVSSVQSGTAS